VQVSDEVLVAGDQPYALQLIGFYTLDTMLDFARREELPPESTSARKVSKGVHGSS
jgi:hypothetical protein